MKFDDIKTKREADKIEEINTPVGRVLDAVEAIAEGALPHPLKVMALTQAASLLENADVALTTPEGMTNAAAGRSVFALGAAEPTTTTSNTDTELLVRLRALASGLGATDADTLLTSLTTLFQPLVSLHPDQRNARSVGAAAVLNGTTPVETDGTPSSQVALTQLQRDTAPMLSPLRGVSAAEQQARVRAMVDIAQNGVPSPTAPPSVDPKVAAFDDLKAKLRPARISDRGPNVQALDLSALSATTRTALGL